jgi:N-methylhydantoinase B
MFNPPFGLLGGQSGDGGALYRVNKDGTRTFFSMIGYFRVREGESWVSLSTGGGGYGSPLERDPERVRNDVRDEFISLQEAAGDYGVVLDPITLEIDDEATAKLREKLGQHQQCLLIIPTSADAATYYQQLMQPGDYFELDPRPPIEAAWTL